VPCIPPAPTQRKPVPTTSAPGPPSRARRLFPMLRSPDGQGALPGKANLSDRASTRSIGGEIPATRSIPRGVRESAGGRSPQRRLTMGLSYSRCASTPSPRNQGRAILSLGGVCLDSACDWWLRLLGVFPVWDFEPGSVFGLITGDPDPGTPSRE